MVERRHIVRSNETRKVIEDKVRNAMGQRRPGLTPQQIAETIAPDKAWLIRRKKANQQQVQTPQQQVQSRSVPPVVRKQFPLAPDNGILLTGGIGDIITLESFFTEEQRQSLKTIYYATRAQRRAQELFASLKCYPSLQAHVILWDDFSKIFAFHNKKECQSYLHAKRSLPPNWNGIADWSIQARFTQINNGNLRYNGSSLLKQKLCDVGSFQLPEKYVAICPYTINDKRNPNRDFDDQDWLNVIDQLRIMGMHGVVLNIGSDRVPNDTSLINLTNKTSILQSVEILKGAKGYIGIDSCLSVLAAKLFDPPFLFIKTQNAHCLNYKHIYYAPKTSFEFLIPRLEFR